MTARPVIAWDIETVPQQLDDLSERQRRRLHLEVEGQRERNPSMSDDELIRRACSFHPMLGRICCVSFVRQPEDGMPRPHSYVAPTRADEADMLRQLWADIAGFRRPLWVTYNGKRFDCDWLRVRSAAHGIAPTRRDILDTYPFRHEPHCDLAKVFDCRAGLADLCDLVGVPNPKSDLDGSQVAEAVKQGRIADVVRYCEADVVATLAAYEALAAQV